MKKIISLLLCMVMIFSFAMPSFASSHTSELDALNSIDDWSESIWQVITNKIAAEIDVMVDDLDLIASRNYTMLSYLLDISDFTRSTYREIEAFTDSFFNEVSWGEPFAEVVQNKLNNIDSSIETLSFAVSEIPGSLSNIQEALYTIHGLGVAGWEEYEDSWFLAVYNDIHQLKEVLADEEDLAFKESQKENQQYIQDTFFNPGSDLSLDVSKLTDFTNQFTDFTESFNFIEEVGTSISPLESISEGSDFSQWFTTETGQDMDPTFNGGSGGGGGEDPDPDPDPDPEPSIKNWLPLATTDPGGTEILNGVGYLLNYRWSGSSSSIVPENDSSVTGWLPISFGDTVYFYFPEGFPSSGYRVFYLTSGGTTQNVLYDNIDSSGVASFTMNNINFSYFRLSLNTLIDDSFIITINEYPIQTASTFSLRAQSVPYEPEVVTSYYADRMAEYYSMLGGDK